MWWDELKDKEYYDQETTVQKTDPKDFFHTPITPGKPIVHAITGLDTGFKICTQDEYRFFVIMERDPESPKEARRLYFDTPEQYERATGNVVPDLIRQRFHSQWVKS